MFDNILKLLNEIYYLLKEMSYRAGLVFLILLILIAALLKRNKKIINKGLIFNVTDMTCDHCVKTVSSGLKRLKGVEDVIINLKTGKIEVLGKVLKKQIVSTIKQLGYTVKN